MSIHNGMLLIKPTSVEKTGASSTATINASGSVTFSLCESLSLNDVFSSTFDNYIIDIRHLGTANTGFRARLRSSGIDATGTDYTKQYIFALDTSVTAQRSTTQDHLEVGAVSTNRGGDIIYFYGPGLAQPTACRNVSIYGRDGATIYDLACTHSLSTAYDGFTLYPNSGTLTGLVKVYGLRQ